MGFKGSKEKSDGLECPFRVIEASLNQGETPGKAGKIICEAGGGKILKTQGEHDGKVPMVCLSCDIPAALSDKYACMYLIPFRIFGKDKVQSYYACSWFLTLNPQKVPKDTVWCRGCPYWFPRPDESQLRNRIKLSHKARQLFLSPPEEIVIIPRDKIIKPRRWHQRINKRLRWKFHDKN